jgi:hypothetical protein
VAISAFVNHDQPERGVIIDPCSNARDLMADPMTNVACQHKRTRLIAKDDDSQYVECVDCGEILEAGEIKANEPAEGSRFGESLSDA